MKDCQGPSCMTVVKSCKEGQTEVENMLYVRQLRISVNKVNAEQVDSLIWDNSHIKVCGLSKLCEQVSVVLKQSFMMN
jgi:hypothetical protein